MEEFDARGRPRSPDQLPRLGLEGSHERGLVPGLCRVHAVHCPSDYAVALIGERRVRDSLPQA